ncbi:hypothetical protein [Nostoc sp.]|uniref:hypothetical protein n=1 Tax=Nostoc sp. TaxID=1180 RepID=UPI002FF7269C
MFDDIVKETNGQLQAIIIFDFSEGLPIFYSKQLKDTDPKLNYTLFGDNDIGVALENFENLKQVSKALDSFGKTTKSGSLQYCIFMLTNRYLMVYFMKLPDITVAICFIALTDVPIDRLVDLCENKIDQIKDELNNKINKKLKLSIYAL